jgi:hypothetical protein
MTTGRLMSIALSASAWLVTPTEATTASGRRYPRASSVNFARLGLDAGGNRHAITILGYDP